MRGSKSGGREARRLLLYSRREMTVVWTRIVAAEIERSKLI